MAAVKIVFALFVAACIFGFASAIFNLGNNDELGRKCGNETGASAGNYFFNIFKRHMKRNI